MTNATFKIVLRKDRPKSDGQFPVCLRVLISRNKKLFPLNFTVFEKDFDLQGELVKKSDYAFHRKNLLIQKAINKANDIKFDFALEDKNLSMTAFVNAFVNDNYGSKSFYEYIEYLIQKRENELSAATIQFYRKHLSKLRRFRPELNFGEVDQEFIYKYKMYMIKKLGNTEITWNKSLEFIKRVCNQAYKEKKISENPVRDLEIKRPKGKMQHLTIEEVSELERLYQSGTLKKVHAEVLSQFLFACYTGMRYRDVRELRKVNIKEAAGMLYTDFIQHKTAKPTTIPLIEQAVKLIPDDLFEQQRVFAAFTNQHCNRKLAEIMELANIQKRITFHSARHTCSNVLFALGVPIEVRSMIIGDTKETVSNFYTSKNLDVLQKALEVYSKALIKG